VPLGSETISRVRNTNPIEFRNSLENVKVGQLAFTKSVKVGQPTRAKINYT